MFSYVHLLSLQEFENDISDFNQRVEDLDRRLGTVFIQAFDDAPGLEHAFKVCTGRGATPPFSPVLHSPGPLTQPLLKVITTQISLISDKFCLLLNFM